MEIISLSALELAAKIHSGEITVKQALDAYFDCIESNDEKYNCYITLCKETAYQRAEKVQSRIDSGDIRSPLAGVPMAIKDNICTKGILTTCGSKILENFKPTYDATVIEKLYGADVIILGKVNMDEFAMGSTTETSAAGVTRNPWNTQHVPGGSSGGSAAAVAALEAPASLGSDTGGSIRQPSSFCGVTGLKPTYGAVSRRGLVAFASSLDQIGPIAHDAADCAAIFEIISGKDSRDSTSMDFEKFDYKKALNINVKGKKIGIPEDFFGEGLNPEVKARVMEAVEVLRGMGAEVESFPLPIAKYAIPTYYIIACAEACSNLSRYDGIKYGYSSPHASNIIDTYIKSRSEGFGMEVKRRIMLGNFVLSSGYYDAYYKKALQAKRLIQKAFLEAFEKYDIILGPVYPTTAPKCGESLSDPLKMYLGDIYTVMINIAGLPAISVPCGFDGDRLPVGLQLIGKPFSEALLLGASHAYQKVTDFHKRTPGGAE